MDGRFKIGNAAAALGWKPNAAFLFVGLETFMCRGLTGLWLDVPNIAQILCRVKVNRKRAFDERRNWADFAGFGCANK